MKKITLFLMSLFLTVGAMAQTELNGCYVTFTNVQQDGTEYSLYVSDQGALTISQDPAANLGESAKFKCELQENGKYTFYNEKANVYMIWRGKGAGYNSDNGVLTEYNATYCDWNLVQSTNKPGCYYIVGKRSNGTDGSLIIMRNNATFDAYGNSEGWSSTYSNVYRITNLSVGETVGITYEFTYNGEVKDELTYTTDAEIGKEFPTIFAASFPFGITATKPAGIVEESHEGQTFTIELEENLPFVAAESYEKITHWYYMTIKTGADARYLYHEAGQTNIPLDVATSSVDAKYAWAFVGNPFDGYQIYNYAAGVDMILSSSTTMSGSNGGGTYPVMTSTPVPNGNNTLWIPTASSHGTNGFFLGQKDYANNRMNNRDSKLAYWTGGADNGSTFMVSRCLLPDAYYRVAYDNEGTKYYLQGVASSVKGCAFTTATDAESVWYYSNSKILSYSAGKYIKEDGNTRGLQAYGAEGSNVTIAASPRVAGKYTVQCSSYLHFNTSGSNYFGDHCGSEGGHATHDMILENVMSLPVTITDAGWATFYAPVAVKVAAGVTAYAVTINGDWATLKAIEGGVIPANTGVVLQGEANTYNFAVTNTTATVDSDLTGTVAATYITDYAYVLTADNTAEAGVCFGKATKNQQSNTSWLNNSHKAYLPMTEGMNAVAYSFRNADVDGDDDATAIEEVETENAEVVIYDLAGRRINEITEGGIYIVNGNKVLVK